jgi:hypothetical protein
MKRILAILAALSIASGLSAQEYSWKAVPMDGSRTGTRYASPQDIDESIGKLEKGAYIAPNGTKYSKKGDVAKVASLVIDAQPSMAAKKEIIGYSDHEIVEGRPWNDTLELANAIAFGKHVSKSKGNKWFGKHPATKVFQAIRVAVNDELGIIERTLPNLPKLLNPGGRVAIITFHSLEDRLVKRYFKENSTLGEESEFELITKSPIVAENMELVINPRARSAKLRVARKR